MSLFFQKLVNFTGLGYINYMKEIEIVLKEGEHLEDILLHHKCKISIHLARMVCWALEGNIDQFSFATIRIEGEEGQFQLGCKREDYLDALRKQLANLLEYEEYEYCPKVQEWIDYLEIEEKLGL